MSELAVHHMSRDGALSSRVWSDCSLRCANIDVINLEPEVYKERPDRLLRSAGPLAAFKGKVLELGDKLTARNAAEVKAELAALAS